MRTNSARRSKVFELGLLTGHWIKKYFSAWRPSLLGITVYKYVISMVKMILFSPEKLKVRNISSAWSLSLMYESSDLTIGVMILSKFSWATHAETIGRPGLLGL